MKRKPQNCMEPKASVHSTLQNFWQTIKTFSKPDIKVFWSCPILFGFLNFCKTFSHCLQRLKYCLGLWQSQYRVFKGISIKRSLKKKYKKMLSWNNNMCLFCSSTCIIALVLMALSDHSTTLFYVCFVSAKEKYSARKIW